MRSGARRNVTFPALQYSVNDERRSALLRPISNTAAHDLVLEAYASYEQDVARTA